MQAGTLFSGIGAFDLAFREEGIETLWQVEIDPNCRRVLEKHFPETEKFEDVAAVRNLRNVNVIVGGFPCQDLSVAGRREGLAGERSGLWFEYHRIIRELQPEWVVIENVPGLLSSNEGLDFAVLIGGLTGTVPRVPSDGWKSSGFARGWFYNCAWRVLDAQYFGLAQRRKRVFIVASRGSGGAAQVLFEPESVPWSAPPRREKRDGYPELAGTLAASGGGLDRPSGNGNALDFCVPELATTLDTQVGTRERGDGSDTLICVPDVAGTLDTRLGQRRRMDASETLIGFHENLGGHLSTDDLALALRSGASANYQGVAFGGGNSNEIDVATCLTARTGMRQDFETETFVCATGHTKANQHPIKRADVSDTLSGGTDFAVGGDFGVRRLTPLECERLQGFPEGWTLVEGTKRQKLGYDELAYLASRFVDAYGRCPTAGELEGLVGDAVRYHQLGNAIAVPVARWITRRIKYFTAPETI
jgi:DNA (cytosine-5)-methyltransferase 1